MTRSRRGILIFICSIAFALAACGNATSEASQSTGSTTNGVLYAATAPASSPMVTGGGQPYDGAQLENDVLLMSESDEIVAQPEQEQQERVILKDANLNITVQDVAGRVAEIGAMAEEMGGWIVTSSTSQTAAYNGDPLLYGSITVRVPANRLTEAMERIKLGAENVNNENVSGRDVTQSYVDLSSRLVNLEAAETQLQLIMDSAKKVEDVLSVFNQLVTTRGEIESIKGQLNYYSEAAAFSSIQVSVNPIPVSPVTQQTTGWSPLDAVEDALSSLIKTVQGAVDMVIFVLIAVLPPLLVIGIPVYLIFRRFRRNRPAVGQIAVQTPNQ